MLDATAKSASPSKYDRLIAAARRRPRPDDRRASLRRNLAAGRYRRGRAGLIVPVLVGPEAKIRAVAGEHGLDIGSHEIVDAPHSHAAAAQAVALIREGRGELLMKGSLHTDELMSEVTASATGLRTERRISHVFIMDVPGHPRRCSSPTPRSTSFPTSMPSATSSRTPSTC